MRFAGTRVCEAVGDVPRAADDRRGRRALPPRRRISKRIGQDKPNGRPRRARRHHRAELRRPHSPGNRARSLRVSGQPRVDRPDSPESPQLLLHGVLELIMSEALDHTNLHRTAKYFMDSVRAPSHEAAVDLLKTFGLTIHVGSEVARSRNHQIALLTLVNVARRTFLGGIEVVGLCEAPSLSALAPNGTLADAVQDLGGRIVRSARPDWPAAVIGGVKRSKDAAPCWQLA